MRDAGHKWAPVGLLALEREPEGGQKSERGIVVAGIGHEGDVHAAGAIDLVVLDLREDELLGDAQGVVAAAVEALRRDAAEVADARKGGSRRRTCLFQPIAR